MEQSYLVPTKLRMSSNGQIVASQAMLHRHGLEVGAHRAVDALAKVWAESPTGGPKVDRGEIEQIVLADALERDRRQ